ncbi:MULTISPECIES: hypothetical protein [Pseudomonas]|uniref:Uncharacterized protein n=2 Tax=Pseudomonas putida TaxID=303 RepID=A0A1L7NP13_PSEPU|nr:MULTISPECIES: hypothetical protein [Pseudomonas]HCF2575818.1 hypothetical protein [Pseudomonas aeruginosa]AGN82368.1 hypothetical protein L483_15605 [Pseudomonas putida H8234]ELS0927159.1 hypothetical protein [Pseudomonas putida]ENY77270.1 hypothetical protein C206_13089 [Pseudomonas putida TRO1]KYC18821.1 hypothetical protein WM94_19040 [Pseudomonas sp. ABFPK]
MAIPTTSDLKLPLSLHLDQNTLDAIERFRAARAEHLKYAHDETVTSAELFLALQRAEFDLATAVDRLLVEHSSMSNCRGF